MRSRLARLRNDQAAVEDEHEDKDETRDLAAEALTTIRGLSMIQAESLVLDAVFPPDPFAR